MEGMSKSRSGVFLEKATPPIVTFGHYTAELASSDSTRRNGAALLYFVSGSGAADPSSLRENRRAAG